MSITTITQLLWQQDRDEIFFMLSRYEAAEEIQHYLSRVKTHYTQLQAQYPELDTRALFQNLEEVNNRVSLYKVKAKPAICVHQLPNNCRTSTRSSNIRTPPQINPASTVPSEDSSQPSSCPTRSDAPPPPYTPGVVMPIGDRLAALPPIPAWDSNVVFAPGTFDGYTPEEIIKHYRPQVHRLVLEGLRSHV